MKNKGLTMNPAIPIILLCELRVLCGKSFFNQCRSIALLAAESERVELGFLGQVDQLLHLSGLSQPVGTNDNCHIFHLFFWVSFDNLRLAQERRFQSVASQLVTRKYDRFV